MEKFCTVLDLCLSHQKVLGYSAVSLLTAGSEHLFSVMVFQCPCNSWNMVYGSVFLLVAALILFLLGFLLNTSTWRLLTGCCTNRRSCWDYVKVTGLVAVSAAVAPLTWIAVALLGANFYECAASGTGSHIIGFPICRFSTHFNKDVLRMALLLFHFLASF
uniref:Uncharacterized protein n=1 Tax=Pelusios castaneus TaxID=367368 RepID=A0A8C8SWP3_9SAUR